MIRCVSPYPGDVGALTRIQGGLRGEGAHDHLAREIALAGRAWANEYFR